MQAATVLINRRALRHNLQRLRELAPASKLVAVVKANAYGHGLIETARTLPDADAFGVARLEEALRLRAGGITRPILLLEGFFEADDLPTISAEHLHTAVHNEEQLVALENAELKEPVTVWMKLDTGMHRLVTSPVPMNRKAARLKSSSISSTPFVKVNRGNAQLRHQAAFCYGRSRILTGRVRGSFFTVSRRWKMARQGLILAVSQSCL